LRAARFSFRRSPRLGYPPAKGVDELESGVSGNGSRETAEAEAEEVARVRIRRPWRAILSSLAVAACAASAAAQAARPAPGALEVQAILEVKKTAPGAAVPVSVRLVNHASTPIGPLEVRVRPLPLDPSAPAPTPRVLGGGQALTQSHTLVAREEGNFTISVWILDGSGDVLLAHEAGTLEVASPSWIGPSAPAVVAAFVTIVGTLLIQILIWRLNRRQRTTETVAQMVVGMARDYFGTLSGTLVELARTVKRLSAAGEEREHLQIRAFFFFGVFLHKENQFAFDQGVMYLPHLWAEGAVSTIASRLLRLVPLTSEQEAMVHKCFADIALMQRSAGPVPGVDFEFRTLFDFERMMGNARRQYAPFEQRRIREVFDGVKARFELPDTVQGILDLEEALRAIIEYESTVMFEEVYVRGDQDRELPEKPPKGFDSIVEGVSTWKRVRELVEQAGAGLR
jgi:hypothetical protein